MQLYSVYFTNKHIVIKYDSNGKKIGEYIDDIPIAIHALPHVTAMQYADKDNFRLKNYHEDEHQSTKQKKRKSTKSDTFEPNEPIVENLNTRLRKAALDGNLAAGLSVAD